MNNKKYFPDYVKNALSLSDIAKFIIDLLSNSDSGKVYVMKKGKTPYEGYHG